MNFFSYFFIKFIAFIFILLYNVFTMKNEIRQPKQVRSLETKNKIIEAGYSLFSEVGYYGTNTKEIAKKAGVSTGIVYGYFEDKRDILISVLDIYIERVFEPILTLMENLKSPVDYKTLAPKVIDLVIKMHKKHSKMHETLHSLASNDEAVNDEFIDLENNITHKIAERFIKLGENIDNLEEKIHLAMNIVQSYAHEYIFDKHEYIDYTVMRTIVEKTIISLFE